MRLVIYVQGGRRCCFNTRLGELGEASDLDQECSLIACSFTRGRIQIADFLEKIQRKYFKLGGKR
jgi:hypothetical protein